MLRDLLSKQVRKKTSEDVLNCWNVTDEISFVSLGLSTQQKRKTNISNKILPCAPRPVPPHLPLSKQKAIKECALMQT